MTPKGQGASVAAPAWNRDELILALDLYFRFGSRIRSSHSEVLDLSRTLRAGRGSEATYPSLRSPHSVHLKLQNFLRFDPTYAGVAMRSGGRLEAEVWAEFAIDQKRLTNTAAAIRQLMLSGFNSPDWSDSEDLEAPEGRFLTRYHLSRERAPKLVLVKKQRALETTGALKCEVCIFDFGARYGDIGRGFIECHHRQPLSLVVPGRATRLDDLALVCSNCHSMLHRGRPWPSIPDLRQALRPSYPSGSHP